jgi:hypothetical protein
MLAKRTRLNFVIGEVSRLPFERRIAPCRDDRMKSLALEVSRKFAGLHRRL